ncbi:MAG: hypothetical protein KAI44_02890 [Methylococcales bacterium]|nr:hypothetical protein [Methylococcales bacterium]
MLVLNVFTGGDLAMEIFDSINLYLMNHPVMIDQLAFAFRIKYWLLLGLAFYFILLPYRHHRKEIKKQIEQSKKPGKFLA